MITDDSLDRLRKSLDQFGAVAPLVWNKRTGHVVGGNQRLRIYQEQGLEKVACSVVDLSLKQEKILNLRLNNLSGLWDWEMVGALLKELDRDDWPLTGFDDLQIEPLLADNSNLPPEADGREYDESAADGVKMATCPKCNHEFPI